MSQEITAIYENGMFRPLQSVSLAEHVTVSLTVRASSDKRISVAPDTVDDFESQLESLLLDGPSLPEDFSRADIYADHD